MPLPNNEKIVALANDVLAQFHKMFGPHPGFRPAHAKGLMLRGTFRPTHAAASLTKAPHFTRVSTPVTVRFSNSSGLPTIPDSSPDANPRGFAIRFNLADHVHTDIVSHSANGFPTHTGAEFLEFLKAAGASGPEVPKPKPIESFLASHPAAAKFEQTPKPFPSSLARETYWGVTAFRFTNAQGESKFGRYQIVPEAGNDFLSDDAAARLRADYHYEELEHRVKQGPIRFKILVQVAAPGDVTDDATVLWPEDRERVEVGTLELTEVLEDSRVQEKQIIFDPIPRVDGIEPSADPLLELRAAIYLLSGRERRAAKA